MHILYAQNMATEYGKRLKLARKHANLTQVALSKATGVPQSTISAAEVKGQGSSETPIYARACGVDVMWLTSGEGEMVNSRQPYFLENSVLKTKVLQANGQELSPSAIKVAQIFDLMRGDLNETQAVFAAQEAVMQSLRILRTPPTAQPAPVRNSKTPHA